MVASGDYIAIIEYFIPQKFYQNDLTVLGYAEFIYESAKNKYYATIKPMALSLKSHKPIYMWHDKCMAYDARPSTMY